MLLKFHRKYDKTTVNRIRYTIFRMQLNETSLSASDMYRTYAPKIQALSAHNEEDMIMKPDVYENNGEGILCVYKNEKWLVSIKNWKPDNDIDGIAHLEIHHSTDEQFILAAGKAILITAEKEEDGFQIELTLMEQGKVYNVPKECWFYSITQKDTRMMYVQDSNCSMENSDFCDLSKDEIAYIQTNARRLFEQ